MPKLAKQYYLNAKGERKINCYKINISKEIIEKTNIKNNDNIKVYAKDNKIIIEKEEQYEK